MAPIASKTFSVAMAACRETFVKPPSLPSASACFTPGLKRGGDWEFAGYRQTDFEFIARTGGNVALLQNDWMEQKTLFNFVPCPEFPGVVPDDVLARNRERMRLYLDWCNLYGLGAAFWLCEMACQGGPWMPEAYREEFLKKFPAEVLSDSGTYQGKVLCLAHPLVQQAYRGMVRRLLRDFPELQMFLVFTQDSNAELCSPEQCERHRGVDKFSQYSDLLALLQTEANLVRPDFQVLFLIWGWPFRSHPDFLARQAALPPGAGLVTLPDGEAWSFDRKLTDPLREQRELTRRHKQTLIGYDIFLWGDDTIFSATDLYDFPLGVAAKLRRWQALGVDGVFDQWGTRCEHNPVNALALRDIFFDPGLTDPKKALVWAENLAEELFGEQAGPQIFSAWQEIEKAQQIQSDHCYYWLSLRLNWAKVTLGTPLTLEALQQAVLSDPEPAKPDGKNNYGPPGDDVETAEVLGVALLRAAEHFSRAVGHLETALKLLPANHVSSRGAWLAPKTGDRKCLSTREHLDKELISVKLQEGGQRELAHFFSAYALVKSLPEHQGTERTQKLDQLRRIQSQAAVSSPQVAELLERVNPGDKGAPRFRSRVSGLPEALI